MGIRKYRFPLQRKGELEMKDGQYKVKAIRQKGKSKSKEVFLKGIPENDHVSCADSIAESLNPGDSVSVKNRTIKQKVKV